VGGTGKINACSFTFCAHRYVCIKVSFFPLYSRFLFAVADVAIGAITRTSDNGWNVVLWVLHVLFLRDLTPFDFFD
jgi:hypothetical protein